MIKYEELKIEEANKYYYNACKENDLETIKYLIDNYQSLDIIQGQAYGNESAIDILSKFNDIDIVRFLLETKNRKEIFLNKSPFNNAKEPLNFSFALFKIGKNNNLNLLKYLINFYKNDLSLKAIQNGLDFCLRGASINGHLEFIDYLLLSEDLEIHPKLSDSNYFPFQLASENGHLNLIKYYLLNKKLKNRPKVTTYKNHAIRSAAWGNHFDLVEYFLTSEELEEHADIHSAGEAVLEAAIKNENIPMIDFLLKSEKLKEHSNLHHKNDLPFRNAVKNNKMLSLQYLICDYEIEKNSNIEKSIKKRRDIQKMFEMRGLSKKLSIDLTVKEIKTKRNKI